jgi:hypothetical protein
MSTYLVALVMSEFQAASAAHPTYPVKVWSRPEVVTQGQYAADIGALMLDAFGAYFEVPYQLPKMDMAAIPDFNAGAMENWGLMTFRETALLWDPVNSGTRNKQSVATVVAHELAHQWFGDAVTMAWWEDIWLNEVGGEMVVFCMFYEFRAKQTTAYFAHRDSRRLWNIWGWTKFTRTGRFGSTLSLRINNVHWKQTRWHPRTPSWPPRQQRHKKLARCLGP